MLEWAATIAATPSTSWAYNSCYVLAVFVSIELQ